MPGSGGLASGYGQAGAIEEVGDGIWLVSITDDDLGYIDLQEKTLHPLDNPFGPKVQSMSQKRSVKDVSGPFSKILAERVGFEPTVGVNLHTLSKRAP